MPDAGTATDGNARRPATCSDELCAGACGLLGSEGRSPDLLREPDQGDRTDTSPVNWFKDIHWKPRGQFDTLGKARPLSGHAVLIVGGGPGINRENIPTLQEAPRAILVNNSYQFWPRPAVVVSLDRRWWSEEAGFGHGKNVVAGGHMGVIAIRPGQSVNAGGRIYQMEKEPEKTYTDNRDVLTGRNSGHAAIHLAMHLGARAIYLAGFDMDFPGGRSHWHGGHVIPSNLMNYEKRFKPKLEELARLAYRRGVVVGAITRTTADIPRLPLDLAMEDLTNGT